MPNPHHKNFGTERSHENNPWDSVPKEDITDCKDCAVKIHKYWYQKDTSDYPEMDQCANHFFGRK